MEKAVNRKLEINADWEVLNEGTPEERACFAALSIYWGEFCLSECYDTSVKRMRINPLLSGYHLAEWLAWNWWRLKWEPMNSSEDWPFAHNMAAVGSGYVWPNVTIFSDGERTALIARPAAERKATSFRYISNVAAVVSSRHFENTIDTFIAQIISQLAEEHIVDTNLHRIWNDLQTERRDVELSKRRKFEALLGVEPDHGDMNAIEQLLSDAHLLGEDAIGEVAANRSRNGKILTAADFYEIATKQGFDGSPQDRVSLNLASSLPRRAEVPAWVLGVKAARLLRDQERLGEGPVSDKILAKLSGVQESALSQKAISQSNPISPDLSFMIENGVGKSRVVFRSKWPAGRRFELARLLGDQLLSDASNRFIPATWSSTFRQKMQRSFAGEFLAPFEEVKSRLNGDFSEDNRQEVANQFSVSPLTIDTLLANHGLLEKDELIEGLDTPSSF